jgi:NAD(P)-dependent dehydrogenase (short-subunit alcohol dehydrogenase family)
MSLAQLFSLEGNVAIVSRGTGVLGGALARGLAAAGARGQPGGRTQQATLLAEAIGQAGGAALPLTADVLDGAQLQAARDRLHRFVSVHIICVICIICG